MVAGERYSRSFNSTPVMTRMVESGGSTKTLKFFPATLEHPEVINTAMIAKRTYFFMNPSSSLKTDRY
jgi:hypothetical protein